MKIRDFSQKRSVFIYTFIYSPIFLYIMKNFFPILLLIMCVALVCSTAGCLTSITNIIDPVVGHWESSMGTSTLDISTDGTGLMTIVGISDSITWNSLGDGVYNIAGSRYTLTNGALQGPIATYYKT